MNTTKKNGFLKAAGLMLVVMMLATCVLSGTMAKYILPAAILLLRKAGKTHDRT